MLVFEYEDREAWLAARRGKITGSRLGDLVVYRGNTKKKGYYELIAERIALPHDGENVMDRGNRLEEEALARFKAETGKKVEDGLVIWAREDNPNIAISPDAWIGKTEACEVKCLSSADHIKAYLTQKVPDEYTEQVWQYFIVNDKLKKLYFLFYDPRLIVKDFFFLEINRKDVQEDIDKYLAYERGVLAEVEKIVTELTF